MPETSDKVIVDHPHGASVKCSRRSTPDGQA